MKTRIIKWLISLLQHDRHWHVGDEFYIERFVDSGDRSWRGEKLTITRIENGRIWFRSRFIETHDGYRIGEDIIVSPG